MIFEDRSEAGRQLASSLLNYRGQSTVVIALPRGGVPIGLEIAKALKAPLNILVVRKLGAPSHPELGIGAITSGGVLILDEPLIAKLRLTEDEVILIERKERIELERRIRLYDSKDAIPDVENKIVILADDGLATGVTARAAIAALLHKNPKKIVVAMPVCTAEAVEGLRSAIRLEDEVMCLSTPDNFAAVGAAYRNFDQVTDEEVIQLLSEGKRMIGRNIKNARE